MCSSPTVRSPWGTTSSSWDHWKRMVAVMCQQCWVSRQLYRSMLTTLLAPPSIPHLFPHQGKGEDLQSQMGTPWSRSWRTLLESRRRIHPPCSWWTLSRSRSSTPPPSRRRTPPPSRWHWRRAPRSYWPRPRLRPRLCTVHWSMVWRMWLWHHQCPSPQRSSPQRSSPQHLLSWFPRFWFVRLLVPGRQLM